MISQLTVTREDVVEAARAHRRTGRTNAADRKRGRRAPESGSNANVCRPAGRSSCAARPTACSSCRGRAATRRGRILLGQSCARRGDRRAAARHPGDHRDAGRRAGGEGRGHAGRGRRDRLLRPAHREPRGDRGADRRRRRGATVVPSFDDPAIVAGQGTAGLEILEQLAERRRPADRRAVRRRRACRRASRSPCPEAEIVIGRARGLGRHGAVARSGRDRAGRAPTRRRPCATRSRPRACRRSPSASCASARRRRSAVTDAEVEEAIRFAWRRASGSWSSRAGRSALAALLAGKIGRSRETVVVLSGGNVDPALHARIVGSAA